MRGNLIQRLVSWQTAALLFICVAVTEELRAQTYYFSAPVAGDSSGNGSGQQALDYSDPQNTANGYVPYPVGSENVTFGTVTGSLTYNSVADTLRFAGSVTANNSASTVVFSDNQKVNGVQTPATITVNYAVGNLGNIAFDSGTVGAVSFLGTPIPNEFELNVPLNVSGTYSLASGGQVHDGTFGYTVYLPLLVEIGQVTADSLTFTEDSDNSSPSDVGSYELGQWNADDGVQMTLNTVSSDTSTYFSWHVDGDTGVVPEPTTIVILGCGLFGLALLRRRATRH